MYMSSLNDIHVDIIVVSFFLLKITSTFCRLHIERFVERFLNLYKVLMHHNSLTATNLVIDIGVALGRQVPHLSSNIKISRKT